MASSKYVSVDELETLLECPICMERIKEPRSLPCFHNFCKTCLDKYVEGLRDGKNIETFPCPTCRSEFTLKSNENVEGMAGNYFIRNMLEVMSLQQEAKVSIVYFKFDNYQGTGSTVAAPIKCKYVPNLTPFHVYLQISSHLQHLMH